MVIPVDNNTEWKGIGKSITTGKLFNCILIWVTKYEIIYTDFYSLRDQSHNMRMLIFTSQITLPPVSSTCMKLYPKRGVKKFAVLSLCIRQAISPLP